MPGTFDYGFYTGLMYKDVRLCVEEGEAMGVPMPIAGAVHQMWLMANSRERPGLGLHRDHQDHRGVGRG
jgi:3-hydroxyisobutyrate dehydrogenase-like beta-hydroxyacid dehydrogenase